MNVLCTVSLCPGARVFPAYQSKGGMVRSCDMCTLTFLNSIKFSKTAALIYTASNSDWVPLLCILVLQIKNFCKADGCEMVSVVLICLSLITDALELWCWRRLLRVPWTARRSNQSILKEINPKYSLEELMLKLKLQYFGQLLWRADSLEKTLTLGKMKAGGEGGDKG